MRKYESYKCSVCGNEVEVQNVGGGKLVCCGKEMECITTNLTAVNLMKAFAGESQARNILGFPDATILKDSFGIYVADNIQKIQMVFIEKCSDSTSTSMALQEFLNWLVRTNELRKFIKRAESRKKIIHIISEENEK